MRQQAVQWSENMVRDWLKAGGMFKGDADKDAKADKIAKGLGDRDDMKTHNRHVSADKAKSLGLKVNMLEDDKKLQEHVLTVHHCCIQTLGATTAYKLIENQEGMAVISYWEPISN